MATALRANNTLETLEIGNLMVGAKVKLRSSGEIKVVTHPDYYGDIKVEGDVRLKHSEFDLVPAVLPLKQLRENTVTELNLSNSSLGVDGGIMLAAVFEGNQSVQWVDVSQNSLGPEGGEALASALQTNTSITTVS